MAPPPPVPREANEAGTPACAERARSVIKKQVNDLLVHNLATAGGEALFALCRNWSLWPMHTAPEVLSSYR